MIGIALVETVIIMAIKIFIVVLIIYFVKWLELVLLRIECLLLDTSIATATNLLSFDFSLCIGV